jgi:hypothetical protein
VEGYEYLKERMSLVSEADRLRLWQPPITGEIIMQTFGLSPSRGGRNHQNCSTGGRSRRRNTNEMAEAFNRMIEEGRKLGLEAKE